MTTLRLALSFDLSCVNGPTRDLRSLQHSSPDHGSAETYPRLGGSPGEGLKNILVCINSTRRIILR
jgi:hypothetical protein